jgi:hypothetical protein
MYYYHAVDVVVVLELKINSITNGKRQNADPRSMNYLCGPGPWTIIVDHGPLQWTTLVDHLRDTRFWGFEFLTMHGKMCSSRVQSLLSLWKLYTKCEVLNPFTI